VGDTGTAHVENKNPTPPSPKSGRERTETQIPDGHEMTEIMVLHWIKDMPLGATVRQSRWLFGAGETLHFFGLCLMVGGLLIVDLRLLGYIRRIPMRAALAFLPFVIAGFLINLATGIEFFMTDPLMYWPNPAFKLKMFLVLLGGLNACSPSWSIATSWSWETTRTPAPSRRSPQNCPSASGSASSCWGGCSRLSKGRRTFSRRPKHPQAAVGRNRPGASSRSGKRILSPARNA
jgi:hypothetical protein